MSDTVIKVENLSKHYRLGLIGGGTLKDDLNRWWAKCLNKPDPLLKIGQEHLMDRLGEYIWALRDINFEVKQGEVLGIIGRNGAGKSTLLKILSRITAPTSGVIKIKGRIASLLEVGTGFHSELTGRENVYLNGAILGMTKTEVDNKFDEIVDFSGVEQFIDTPVKRYSSGMKVRLAFAVAAHLEPEIMIIDEVLAVGDVAFQKKCVGKMKDVATHGRTILFVSHAMASISALCNKTIYLKDGMIEEQGETQSVISHYLHDNEVPAENVQLIDRQDRQGDGSVRFTQIKFLDAESHREISTIISGQNVLVEVSYQAMNRTFNCLHNVSIGLSFYNQNEQFVMVLNSQMANHAFESLPSSGSVYCSVSKFPLMVGEFFITATIHVMGILTDKVEKANLFYVENGDFFGTGISNTFNRQGVHIAQKWISSICDINVQIR